MNPLSGRIQNNHIRLYLQVIKNLQYVSRNKTAVGQPVQSSILSGCFHCFFYNLHTDHFFCYRRQKLGNGSGSAVKIKDLHASCIFNICADNRIQNLRRQGIWLKKGKRTDPESQPQEIFIKPVLTIQDSGLVTFYHIGKRVIDDMHDPYNFSFQRQCKKKIL